MWLIEFDSYHTSHIIFNEIEHLLSDVPLKCVLETHKEVSILDTYNPEDVDQGQDQSTSLSSIHLSIHRDA